MQHAMSGSGHCKLHVACPLFAGFLGNRYLERVTWSRRQVLRALGMGAAAPVIAPLLSACGGRPPAAAGGGNPIGSRPMAAIRTQLRDLVAELSRRHPDAGGTAMLRVRGGAAFD